MARIDVAEAREFAAARAIHVLADAGKLQLAHRAEALLGQDENDQSEEVFSAKAALKTRERILQLGNLSPFEQFFLEHDGGGFAEVLLYSHRVEHKTGLIDTWLNALSDDLLLGDRRAVCATGVYALLYPAYLQGGADLVVEVVASIEDFDQRFTDRLLRATATGLSTGTASPVWWHPGGTRTKRTNEPAGGELHKARRDGATPRCALKPHPYSQAATRTKSTEASLGEREGNAGLGSSGHYTDRAFSGDPEGNGDLG